VTTNRKTETEGVALRYEAEDTGTDNIGLFYWPAGPLQEDPLIAGKRESVVVTRSSTNKPSVSDTVIYAFKSVAVRSRAYQADLMRSPILSRQYASVTSAPTNFAEGLHISRTAERLLIREPTELPSIGADFTGFRATMSVASGASFDGKYYKMNVGVEAKGASAIQAPYFQMLSATKRPDDLFSYLRLLDKFNSPLPSETNNNATVVFPVEALPLRHLYIIDQPVTFKREGGSVCIMVPTYSPIPIEPSMLSCQLVR
jgi:hypothetical protein